VISTGNETCSRAPRRGPFFPPPCHRSRSTGSRFWTPFSPPFRTKQVFLQRPTTFPACLDIFVLEEFLLSEDFKHDALSTPSLLNPASDDSSTICPDLGRGLEQQIPLPLLCGPPSSHNPISRLCSTPPITGFPSSRRAHRQPWALAPYDFIFTSSRFSIGD